MIAAASWAHEESLMFHGQSLRVELHGTGIAELCFDRQNESINKFDARTVAELKSATDAIRGTPGVRGVLVTSAKEVFIVGADIFEFTTMFAQPVDQIEAHIARKNAVFTANRVESFRDRREVRSIP
jgi:3-hydroxyacyl-CoA dehydrogenase / enoyl-CoA hydratase / 3-hydroxybutyryl-CoA epimerase / enoyl-CoA isomerase